MSPDRPRSRAVAALVAVLLTATGCGAGSAASSPPAAQSPSVESTSPQAETPSPPPGSTITDVLDGQRVRLDTATTEQTVGLALWFHGQRGDVDSFMGSGWIDGIRARGWAVASGDLHGAAWGDPQSVQDVRELAAWATAHADVQIRLLIAGSMGGLTSLNAVLAGAVRAPCWFGTEAVVDLTSVGAVPSALDEINGVYGGPAPARSNPVTRLEELPVSTRYFVVSSAEDTWVPATANTDVLVGALRARGAVVGTAAASGPHGDPSHYRPEDLAAFADACAGQP